MSASSLKVAGASTISIDSSFKAVNLADSTYVIQTAALGDKSAAAVTSTTAAYDSDTKTITVTLAQDAGNGTDPGAITATKDDILKAVNGVLASNKISDLSISLKDGVSGSDKAAAISSTDITSSAFDSSKGIDVSTQKAANSAITTIQNAIQTVSTERSRLGAYQNRLDHTVNNLGTSSENLSAAESRIRDVDMAKEMSEFTKNSVLAQAAQSMVAQANSQPQSVLSLLQ
jgi:flagellin